jgi:hypothetical protein
LEDNLAATQLVLTPEDILEINTVSGLTPEYPGWMVEFQMRDRLPGTTRF